MKPIGPACRRCKPLPYGLTWTCWLAAVKPLADAVIIPDPILMPFTFGAEAAVVAPCGIKMFAGPTVTFEGSLLVSVMNIPLAGAGVASITWNSADWPAATVTLAGKMICPEAGAVPIVTVVRAVTLPLLLVAVKV
jgi:hypothetical protein